jgi:ribosomal protein S7
MVGQSMVVKPLNNFKFPRAFIKKKFFFKFQFFFFLKSFIVQKLINILSIGGKKIKSEKIIIFYLKFLKKKFVQSSPLSSFFFLLDLIKPSIDLVFKRVGKKIHQVPIPIRSHRQYLKGIRSIKKYLISSRHKQNFVNILSAEHLNVITDKSNSLLLKKKQNLFQIAIENRMFTHYR